MKWMVLVHSNYYYYYYIVCVVLCSSNHWAVSIWEYYQTPPDQWRQLETALCCLGSTWTTYPLNQLPLTCTPSSTPYTPQTTTHPLPLLSPSPPLQRVYSSIGLLEVRANSILVIVHALPKILLLAVTRSWIRIYRKPAIIGLLYHSPTAIHSSSPPQAYLVCICVHLRYFPNSHAL